MQGSVGGYVLGGVWVHIKGMTCHIKELPVFKAYSVGGRWGEQLRESSFYFSRMYCVVVELDCEAARRPKDYRHECNTGCWKVPALF